MVGSTYLEDGESKSGIQTIVEFSSLPEAITRLEENEKKVAVVKGKEVAGADGKQLYERDVLPEAIASGADKECMPQSMDRASHKKPWSTKTWPEKRSTRFCSIPVWCILLVGVVLILVGAVAGGVIGGIAKGETEAERKVAIPTSSITLYDASYVSTPTSTSPPKGSFALAFGSPQETQASCLTIPNQQASWACDLASSAHIAINVDKPPGSAQSAQSGALLYTTSTNDSALFYGAQASSVSTTFSPFLLVEDMNNPDYGPAFYFQAYYDKVVVIHEDAIGQGSKTIKRHTVSEIAARGDKPWICYWNDTFLEGFIYDDKAAKTHKTRSSSIIPQQTASPTVQSRPSSLVYAPSQTITTTLTLQSTTATFIGAASAFPSWASANHLPVYSNSQGTSKSSGVPNSKRSSESTALPVYPRVVKIEERRLRGSPRPYCVQYQVLDNYHYNVIVDANGEPIKVTLSEQDPGYGAYGKAGLTGHRKLRFARNEVPGLCHCQ